MLCQHVFYVFYFALEINFRWSESKCKVTVRTRRIRVTFCPVVPVRRTQVTVRRFLRSFLLIAVAGACRGSFRPATNGKLRICSESKFVICRPREPSSGCTRYCPPRFRGSGRPPPCPPPRIVVGRRDVPRTSSRKGGHWL